MLARTVLAFAAVLVLNSTANAGAVVGGSSLLNGAGLAQLEGWLGHGQLTLTNIFTKTTGSTAQSFHNAADGQGATFSLMTVSMDGGAHWETIGGYDPLSWNSQSDYNYSYSLSDRTAFIFNLTDQVKAAQRSDNQGVYQTYDYAYYGPTFGGGHDLHVGYDLNSGYSYGFSYGNVNGVGYYGISSILDQRSYYTPFTVGALEVFTLSAFEATAQQNVPEPASLLLVGLALAGVVVTKSRKKAA